MVGIIEAHSDRVERAAYKLICEHIDVHSGTEESETQGMILETSTI